jgi:ATP/maltotriose-dependent transcriptional regulator MalT
VPIRADAGHRVPDGEPFRAIPRPRVLARLADAARFRVGVVVAPAGYGKSVAVHQFAATAGSSVLYDVPADASALVAFVRGFARALEPVAPTFGASLASALAGTRDSEERGRDLASWAAAHVRELRTLIVLDDLHNGEHDPEIARFVAALVDLTKGGPRWLISTRNEQQLPLASWVAYGVADVPVGTGDLRFTVDEARASARAMGTAVEDEELERLVALVDGWPAALTFAFRISARASDLGAVPDAERHVVYRYMAEQVWASLRERTRTFLAIASFLPRIETRSLAAAGFEDAAAIVAALSERVAFIGELAPGVFKLHDLFRDFVQHQLNSRPGDALRDAEIAAARLLERMNCAGDALERYVHAGAVPDIERVLAEQNFTLIDTGSYDVAERALRALPAHVSAASPRVLAVRAAVEDMYGRTEQAERWYRTALDRLPPEDAAFAAAVATRYAVIVFQREGLDAIPVLETLLERADLRVPERASVAAMLASTYALAGRHDEARALIARAMEQAEFGDPRVRALLYGRAAVVAFYAGDEDAVESNAMEARRSFDALGDYAGSARFSTSLLAMHGQAGRLPETARVAADVAAYAQKAGDPKLRTIALRVLMNVEAEAGNGERVEEIEREIAALSYRGPFAVISYLVAKVLQLGWAGRFAEAESLMSRADDRSFTHSQDRLRFALLAALRWKTGSGPEALEALRRYAAAVKADDESVSAFAYTRGVAARYAVLAEALVNRTSAARKALSALRPMTPFLAAFDEFLRALLERDDAQAERSLGRMRDAGSAGTARFLENLAGDHFPARRSDGADAPLTAAESQVLAAMARGLGNQAIADTQGRTLNTVRSHVSSILRKLHCGSRGEAVAAARRRGLV